MPLTGAQLQFGTIQNFHAEKRRDDAEAILEAFPGVHIICGIATNDGWPSRCAWRVVTGQIVMAANLVGPGWLG